ncbi:transposase [Streptomyces macrosporus]|uniref:transposase n=1 Tax=Streptomyces macrosporus TaxID=44032 RepID=UPI0031D07B02
MRRHEPTDHEWEVPAPLMPRAGTGRPRAEDQRIAGGTVHTIRTGITRRDLPERYGPWKAVHTRFRRRALEGAFTHAPRQLRAEAEAAEQPNP